MALLNPTQKKSKKTSIIVTVDQSRMEEIKTYCTWAHIDRLSNFMLQAADYILKNDKEWRKITHQKIDNIE